MCEQADRVLCHGTVAWGELDFCGLGIISWGISFVGRMASFEKASQDFGTSVCFTGGMRGICVISGRDTGTGYRGDRADVYWLPV